MTIHSGMVHPSHRGAYDHLWSEFRYLVLAVSLKASSRFSRKLGATPTRKLSLLEDLSYFYQQPRRDFIQALLQAYLPVKPFLSRPERRTLMEGFLAHDPNTLDSLYSLILRHRVEALYGCRLFFPPATPIRYYDHQDHPGLWTCLGPYLVHLRGGSLRAWLGRGLCAGDDLEGWLAMIEKGCHQREYELLPARFRSQAEQIGCVVQPGIRVFLHPHFRNALQATQDEQPLSTEALSLLALANWWDLHPQDIPLLPETPEWHSLAVALGKEISPDLDLNSMSEDMARIREEFQLAAGIEQYKRIGWEEAEASMRDDSEEDDREDSDQTDSADGDDEDETELS